MAVFIKSRRGKTGFTLTELAIVLGIFGAVLGSIWVAYGKVHFNRLVQQENNDLLTIATGVQQLRTGNMFSAAECAAWGNLGLSLVPLHVFPSDLEISTAGYPLDREGGELSVEACGNSPLDTGNYFEIEFFGTTQTCATLAYEMSQTTGSSAPVYVFTNTSGWLATPNTPGAPNYNLTPNSFAGCAYTSFEFSL